MSERWSAAKRLIDSSDWAGIEPVFFAGDASARRYFRLDGETPAILMDAPPDAGQDVARFAHLARFLNEAGFSAPKIYAEDRTQGFLLLEDFGDGVFARLAEADAETEARLYALATEVILALGDTKPPADLPVYTPEDMARMIAPAFDWYRWATGGSPETPPTIETGIQAVLEPIPAGTLALRDFHAENLILLPERSGLRRAGLLDFQDAMVGPVGYDLVSLLYDVRRDVSPPVIDASLAKFARHVGQPIERVEAWCAALNLSAICGSLASLPGSPWSRESRAI
jgi:aminoglycoside/choline kinase family phosphotransferase